MADLHTLALLFVDGQRQVNLIYSSEAAAQVDHKRIVDWIETFSKESDKAIALTDSYGTEIVLIGQPLEAIILQNNGKAHEGGVELALLQARAQASAERRAQTDPMLGKRMVQVGQPPFKM